jgi:predicted O-methyltransferase YrrM
MIINKFLKRLLHKLPYVAILKNKAKLYDELNSKLFVEPGHFYSPINDINEIVENEHKIFASKRELAAIDMNEAEQFQLLQNFKNYYEFLFFTDMPTTDARYYYNNKAYSYSDVIFLFSMIMHSKPKRIIEIGSGFSSAAMLDINERYFNNSIDITFIEPYPDNLRKILKAGDKFTLIEKKVQQVDLNVFKSLQENDILFIDSTHVAKTNSDVLFELFEILPLLNKGVKIHFHDIFYPFEYPREWVVDVKRSWNEIYFLRSFLMYNNSFKMLALNTYLENAHTKWFEENMPLCLKDLGGSCWLEKIA